VENVAGPRQLPPGTKLDEKYRIEQLLAVGGMGAVYLGTHTGLRKRVAIKVLNPQSSSKGMVERFHREAITASQIGHEGIAQVTDFGTSFEGEPFLVMEYLEGESLAARLTTSGPLPVEVACELGCAILAPLAAAHEAGIVHRDLKPDNVFLVRQSRGEIVKLLDFGISRAPGLEGEFRLTKTGLVLGTPYYMSPEQARGDSEIGPAADLYAFGVILYEMLVGAVPIEGENYNQLMYRVLTAEYAKPRAKRPEIPEELEKLILQAMALDPQQRPGTAGELEARLLAFCRPTFRDHQIERISSSSGLSLHLLSAGVTAPMNTPVAVPAQASSPIPAQVPAAERDSALRIDLRADPRTDPRAETRADTGPVAMSDTRPLIAGSALETAPPARPTRRRALVIAGAAVVLCGGLVGALVISNDDGDEPVPRTTDSVQTAHPSGGSQQPAVVTTPPPPSPEPPSPEPRPAEPATPPTPPAAPEITLQFETEPATAMVELDGVVIMARELTVPKDGAPHRLRISAPGYVTRDAAVKFDVTQRLVYQLKPAPGRWTRSGRGGRPPKPEQGPGIASESPY
jgi:serine/threonine-protein kinase